MWWGCDFSAVLDVEFKTCYQILWVGGIDMIDWLTWLPPYGGGGGNIDGGDGDDVDD